MGCVLSIDWDFFIWNGGQAAGQQSLTAFPGTPDETQIPAMHLFDWGHNEAYPAVLQKVLWHTRHESFRHIGIDMEKEANIRIDRGCVAIEAFLSLLRERFDLDMAITWLADSHSWGITMTERAAVDSGRSVEMVHFDAHCDLGYSGDKVSWEKKKNICDCGSWLWHALDSRFVESVLIVYPDWRGLGEWESMKKEPHIKRFQRRIAACTWEEFAKRQEARRAVDYVYLCRSSSWTPPYLDSEFLTLVAGFGEDRTCLDCSDLFRRKIGAFDACKVRV